MAPWLELDFACGNGPSLPASCSPRYLGRPIAVLEKRGKQYLNPAKVYGARAADGSLLHGGEAGSPETVPTLKLVPIAELVEQLRANPLACSVVEYNGSNHFDPWLLKPSLRAAAIAAAASANFKADASNDAAAETEEEEVEEEEDDVPMPAALVDDEWIELPGGPWTARLMRKARQSAAPPGHRVFGVSVTFGSATPIYAGGAVKFMDVPGGPAQGIICSTSTQVKRR